MDSEALNAGLDRLAMWLVDDLLETPDEEILEEASTALQETER